MEDALFDKYFIILNKKYYLTDGKYYNTNYFLYLYHSIRYHLEKQDIADQMPTNKEKSFNFCYFSFWNIFERIFDIIKRQFQIFETLAEFIINI